MSRRRRARPTRHTGRRRRSRRAGPGQPHHPTASFLPPLGRPQLHRHLVLAALAVVVGRLFGDDDSTAFDRTHDAAVRPDRRPDLHDVAELLVVLDDRPRVTGLVDDGDQLQLADFIALEWRARLARLRRARARRPERIPSPRRIVRYVARRLDRARNLHLVRLRRGAGIRRRCHRDGQQHCRRRPHVASPGFLPSAFFFSCITRCRSVSSRKRNVVVMHEASTTTWSPTIRGLVSWMFVTFTMRSRRFTRSRNSATSWYVP